MKGQRPSRAYLYMNDPLLVYDFRAAFDGHSFVNERGVQFRCSVEFAPYQKAPKVITKKDPREGTLDKGPPFPTPSLPLPLPPTSKIKFRMGKAGQPRSNCCQ